MRALFIIVGLTGLIGAWVLSSPETNVRTADNPNPERGEWVFNAAGCGSCHAAPDSDDYTRLAGGKAFPSPFGTFYAPNISPSDAGIGDWSNEDFTRALQNGVSPEGKHYYPAFPYQTYANMNASDISALYSYIMSLPPVDTANRAHDLPFYAAWRRPLGIWKRLAEGDPPSLNVSGDARYMVEALGHCSACHTPRNALGLPQYDQWMQGAKLYGGNGSAPDITMAGTIGDWSKDDIIAYLMNGNTPSFDFVGGEMADVVTNLGKLPEEDVALIADYLQALPAQSE